MGSHLWLQLQLRSTGYWLLRFIAWYLFPMCYLHFWDFSLIPTSAETVLHHRMRRQGYQEERKWPSPGQSTPFSVQLKKPRVNVDLIGESFLRRFQNPTIFLKISCDGDFLLPIIVGIYVWMKLKQICWCIFCHFWNISKNKETSASAGEFSIEKLIDPQWEDKKGVIF